MKKLLLACYVLVSVTSVCFSERISVASINVWSGLTYEGTFRVGEYEDFEARMFRYGLLLNGLKGVDADVIGVNEANPLPRYAKRLSRDLGYSFVHHVGLGGVRLGVVGLPTNLREGDVILARPELELTALGYQNLYGGYAGNFASFHFADSTQIVASKITVDGREVYVFVTHLHASEFASKENLRALVDQYDAGELQSQEFISAMSDAVDGSEVRAEEVETLIAFVDSIAGEAPVILMGDFNALPSSREIRFIKEAGFVDCWSKSRYAGYTWDEIRNKNILLYQRTEEEASPPRRDRIDYIFVRGNGIQPRSAELILNDDTFGIHPSDHFGVYAEIDID